MKSWRPSAWMPALLVGAAGAAAAEVAMGLLLYGGPGLVRSLTTILAIEGTAFAAGLWNVPRTASDAVERLRRRWVFCLTAFLIAAVYSGAWSMVDVVAESRWGHAVGLALLGGLPLYGVGTVLAGMSVADQSLPGATGRTGPAAAMGAALGFVAAGVVLPMALLPAYLLIGCIAALSLSGMLYGVSLGDRLDVEVRLITATSGVDVRVEDRSLPADGSAERVMLEAGHERARRELTAPAVGSRAPWEVAVSRALVGRSGDPVRLLGVGLGASSLPKLLLGDHRGAVVEVLERNGSVVEAGLEHFDTGLRNGDGDRLAVRVGNFEDLVRGTAGPFDLVIVDARALAALGGPRSLSRSARSRLVGLLAESGRFAWGPFPPSPDRFELVGGWPYRVYRRWVGDERVERVIVTGREGVEDLPADFDGFVPVPEGDAPA